MAGKFRAAAPLHQTVSQPTPRTHVFLGSGDCGATYRWLHPPVIGETGDTRLAWVDADPGNATLGPPGVLTLAFGNGTADVPRDLRPHRHMFFGALDPAISPDAFLFNVVHLIDLAREQNVHEIRIDLPPALHCAGAEPWLGPLLRLIRPNQATLIAETKRFPHLSRLVNVLCGTVPDCVTPDPAVRRKSRGVREVHVTHAIARAIDNAEVCVLDPARVPQTGIPIGNDEPVPAHRCRWASEALGMPIHHGVFDARRVLTLWTSIRVMPSGWLDNAGWVAESLGANSLKVVSLHEYDGLVMGLHGMDGRLKGLGRLEGWDTDRDGLRIRIPRNIAPESLGYVEWGHFRVETDGRLRSGTRGVGQKRGTPGDAGVYFG